MKSIMLNGQRAEGKGAARILYFLHKPPQVMERVCRDLREFQKKDFGTPEEKKRASIAYERIHNRMEIYRTEYSEEERKASCEIAVNNVGFRKSLLALETDLYDIQAKRIERQGKEKVASQRDKCKKEVAEAMETLRRKHSKALNDVKQLKERHAKSIEQAICRANEEAQREQERKRQKVQDEQSEAFRKLDRQKATAIKNYREAREKEISYEKKNLDRAKKTAIEDHQRANQHEILDQKNKLNEEKNKQLKQLATEKRQKIKDARSAAAEQIEKETIAARESVNAAKRQLDHTTQVAIQSHKRKMGEAGTGPKKKAKGPKKKKAEKACSEAKVSNSRCRRSECLWNHLGQTTSHSVCRDIAETWCQVEQLEGIRFFYEGKGPFFMRRCVVDDDKFSFAAENQSAYDGLVRADLCRQTLQTGGRGPRWEFTLQYHGGAKKAWETTAEGASEVDASPHALNVATTWATELPFVFDFIWDANMTKEKARLMRLHLFKQHAQDVRLVKHESDGYVHGLPNSVSEPTVRRKLLGCQPHLMYHDRNPDDPKSRVNLFRLKPIRTHLMCRNERAYTGLAKAARQLFG